MGKNEKPKRKVSFGNDEVVGDSVIKEYNKASGDLKKLAPDDGSHDQSEIETINSTPKAENDKVNNPTIGESGKITHPILKMYLKYLREKFEVSHFDGKDLELLELASKQERILPKGKTPEGRSIKSLTEEELAVLVSQHFEYKRITKESPKSHLIRRNTVTKEQYKEIKEAERKATDKIIESFDVIDKKEVKSLELESIQAQVEAMKRKFGQTSQSSTTPPTIVEDKTQTKNRGPGR